MRMQDVVCEFMECNLSSKLQPLGFLVMAGRNDTLTLTVEVCSENIEPSSEGSPLESESSPILDKLP
jgi:hypothetical protein